MKLFELNGEQTQEQKLFKKTRHVKNLIRNINKRLGFRGKKSSNEKISRLSFDDIKLMWDICKYQTRYNFDQISYFCAAFNRDDLKVC